MLNIIFLLNIAKACGNSFTAGTYATINITFMVANVDDLRGFAASLFASKLKSLWVRFGAIHMIWA